MRDYRWTENRATADHSAGVRLCEYAMLEYSREAAKFLAEAIAKGESWLLSPATIALLHRYSKQELSALATDILH